MAVKECIGIKPTMEESPVKKILTELRAYLHENLRIDTDFIAGLSASGLLSDSDASSLRSSVTRGGNEALYGLLNYIEWFYDEKMLEEFCVFLDVYSKKAKPRLREVAAKIRQEMEKHQPEPIHQSQPKQEDSSSSSSTALLIQDQNHLHQELCKKDIQIQKKDRKLKHMTHKLKKEVAQLKKKDAQLEEKDTQLQQKDAQLRELHAELKQQHTLLEQKDAQFKQKDAELRHKDEESGRQYAVLLHEHQQLQQEHDQLRRERHQLHRETRCSSSSAKPVVKKPPRNWKEMKCQKLLKCGNWCCAVATKGNHIAVSVHNNIKMYDRNSTKVLHNIGEDQLGNVLYGVAFYNQEHIFVSDRDNSNIKMFTVQGQHIRTIDRGNTTFKPKGITISPDGHIYVCDGANHFVCVFDVNGKFLFSFGSRGSGDKCFDCPRDLCFASDGFLYITDVNNSRICVYDKDGKSIREFTPNYQPTCIVATDCGHLIVSSVLYHKFMIYTTGGDLVHVFGELGSELGQFSRPIGVSVDSDGLIYIADQFNNRIQVF